jgi:3-methyladenine DNA glycosylase AlkD
MEYHHLLVRLKSLGDSGAIAGMARYGITTAKAFGVSIPKLRKLAKEIAKNHELAQKLWSWRKIFTGLVRKAHVGLHRMP